MIIYYDFEEGLGVNYQYQHVDGSFVYDSDFSLVMFFAWASLEFPNASLVEITLDNYQDLLNGGLING